MIKIEGLAIETHVFNTQTNEGDSSVLKSFKTSALNQARIVLSHDKRNGPARRVAKWAVRDDLHDPDLRSLTATFRQAGLEACYLKFNPSS